MKTSYDVVVIGGGHNGLSVATYLARSGLATIVLEAGSRTGGRAVTDEDLLPGHRLHAHANYLSFPDLQRRSAALVFGDLGVRTLKPLAQHGLCFRDGRPPVVLYREDRPARTKQSLEHHSRRDAKTFANLKARGDRLTDTLARTMFGLPDPDVFTRHQAAVDHVYADMGLAARLGRQTALALINELFDSPAVRTLLYQLHLEFAGSLLAPGGDAAFLGYVVWLLGRRRMPVTGMSAVTDALLHAATAAGAQIVPGTPVERILVSNGRAQGVCTGKGDIIEARSAVVSAIGVAETHRQLLDHAVLGPRYREDISALERTSGSAIGNLRFCLAQPPRYRSARWNKDIDSCWQTFVGLDEPEEVLASLQEVELGQLPAPAGAVHVNSLWDQTQAPSGRHSAGVDFAMPAAAMCDPTLRVGVERSFPAAFAQTWRGYAPNLAPEIVLAGACTISGGADRSLLLTAPERAYKGGVEALYLCGPATFPGGGVHGACAYNAYLAMQRDWAEAAKPQKGDGCGPRPGSTTTMG